MHQQKGYIFELFAVKSNQLFKRKVARNYFHLKRNQQCTMFYVRRHYLSSRYDDSKSPMGPIGIKGMTSSSPSSGLPTSGTGGRAVGGLEGGESDLHLTQNITLRKKRKIFGGKQQKTATGTNNFSLSLDVSTSHIK